MGRGRRCPCPCPCGWSSKAPGNLPRRLYAFDFDNTILDGDTESSLTSAYAKVKGRGMPASIRYCMEFMSEVEYAQFLMDYLVESGVPLRAVIKQLATLRYVNGMPRLLRKVDATTKEAPWSHFIVISGSFDFFIRGALATGLHPAVSPTAIIANHATPTKQEIQVPSSSKGPKAKVPKNSTPTSPTPPTAKTTIQTLHFTPYEHQTTCSLCAPSLCKGAALSAYIAQHGPFEQVVFVGDGGNDICPALRLGEGDLLFVRKGYALETAIRTIQEAERENEGGGGSHSHLRIHTLTGASGHGHAHDNPGSGSGSKTRSPSPPPSTLSTPPSPSSAPSPKPPKAPSNRHPLIKAEVIYFQTAKHIQERLGL